MGSYSAGERIGTYTRTNIRALQSESLIAKDAKESGKYTKKSISYLRSNLAQSAAVHLPISRPLIAKLQQAVFGIMPFVATGTLQIAAPGRSLTITGFGNHKRSPATARDEIHLEFGIARHERSITGAPSSSLRFSERQGGGVGSEPSDSDSLRSFNAVPSSRGEPKSVVQPPPCLSTNRRDEGGAPIRLRLQPSSFVFFY
jgi:hypothetical protein